MFTIALIGRTNVGKSTLFNRLVGEVRAITSPLPHTTRDRNVAPVIWRDVTFRCIDTGGIEELAERTSQSATDTIEDEIRTQARMALADADCFLFITDVHDGILPGERAIARELRRIKQPILVVCNKVERAKSRIAAMEFAALGLGDPIPVSAITGAGVGDLLDRVLDIAAEHAKEHPPKPVPVTPAETPVRIAIVGEPNVGKSSLINAILGRKEVIVRPEPFTTRDVHDVAALVKRQPVILLDTAGIRRTAIKTSHASSEKLVTVERNAVARSMRAIRNADVAVLVLDATRSASRHTKHLAQTIIDAKRACVIVINKHDLMQDSDPDVIATNVPHLFPHLAWAPVIITSALTGTNVHKVLPAAIRAATAWRHLLPASTLTTIYGKMRHAIRTPSTPEGKHHTRTIELRQTETAPPTFLLLTRKRVRLPHAVPQLIERELRNLGCFTGTPIVLTVKSVG